MAGSLSLLGLLLLATGCLQHPADVQQALVIRNEKSKLLVGLQLPDRPAAMSRAFLRGHRQAETAAADEMGTFHVTMKPITDNGLCLPADADEPLTNCFTYHFDTQGSLIEADISIHLKPQIRKDNFTLFIYEVSLWGEEMVLLEQLEIGSVLANTDDLTVRVDLADDVRSWMRIRAAHPFDKFIKVDAKINGQNKEFTEVFNGVPNIELVIGRKKISNTCDEASRCCLKSFYVNFTEIGWSDWVLSPPGYYANYCVGPCTETAEPDSQTASILRDARSSDSSFFIPRPGCAPSKFAPLTLIYAVDENEFRKTTIHGMRALQCSCYAN